MKVVFLIDPTESKAQYYWRVHNPVKFLNRLIDAVVVDINGDIEVEGVDIFVIPKLVVDSARRSDALKLFTKLRSKGARIVYDADDDMWSEHYVEYMVHLFMQRGNVETNSLLITILENKRFDALWTLEQCDYVTVSTHALRDYLNTITGLPVAVIPNAIDVQFFENQLIFQPETDFVRLGWAGGSRPLFELDPMLTAWSVLAKEYKNLRFVFAGWLPALANYENVLERCEHIKWTDISKYAPGMQVDIGCVCVSNQPFASRKSPIKAYEFALAGAMVVGSYSVYKDEPIIVASNVDEWVQILNLYLKDMSNSRKALAESYRTHVKGYHDMRFEYWKWFEIYRGIINHASNIVSVH